MLASFLAYSVSAFTSFHAIMYFVQAFFYMRSKMN